MRKNAKIRNRYNQVPHLNHGIEWESDKIQENITHRRGKRSSLTYQVTTKLQDTGSTRCQRQTHIHKRSTALERSVRKELEGLNSFKISQTEQNGLQSLK